MCLDTRKRGDISLNHFAVVNKSVKVMLTEIVFNNGAVVFFENVTSVLSLTLSV